MWCVDFLPAKEMWMTKNVYIFAKQMTRRGKMNERVSS